MDDQKFHHAAQLRNEIVEMSHLLSVFDEYKKKATKRNHLAVESKQEAMQRRAQVELFNKHIGVRVVFSRPHWLTRTRTDINEIKIPGSAIDKVERIMKLHLNHLQAQYEKL